MSLRGPGVQPERTALAWSRTTLALVGAGLLCVRLAPTAAGAAVAAVVVCGGAGLQLHRAQVSMHERRRRSGGGAADPGSILISTLLTILLAVTAVLFAV